MTTEGDGPSADDAMVDPLTGLLNHRHFADAVRNVSQTPTTGSAAVILLLDLDRFRGVNDALGEAGGDVLLRLAGKRLRRETREEDVLARLGGDAFAVLMPNGEQANVLAQRLVDVLSQPFKVQRHVICLGVSVGMARIADAAAGADALMRHAELALRAAKRAGGRTWRMFQPAMAVRDGDRRIALAAI